MRSGAEGLKKELEVLWRLQNSSAGHGNQFIVRCVHQALVSSPCSSPSCNPADPYPSPSHRHTPILTTANPLSLSSPTSDPDQFSIPPAPMMECGGPNLWQFVNQSHCKLDPIHRVHIVRDVMSALGFLHDHGIVHGDLKPENIVSFSSLGEGVRWKLVDLEHSHDLRVRPPPAVSPLCCAGLGCTPEYSAPELLELLAGIGAGAVVVEPLLVTPQLDIWSLGMVSVFALKGCTVWRLLSPDREFSWAMVREWDDASLKQLLSFFGEKEKAFLGSCLGPRLSCRKLLSKSLFGTGNSTIQGSVLKTMSEELSRKFEELREFVSKLVESSGETMSSDLNDLLLALVTKLERQGRGGMAK
jgi:serine/threonine protein kinase